MICTVNFHTASIDSKVIEERGERLETAKVASFQYVTLGVIRDLHLVEVEGY